MQSGTDCLERNESEETQQVTTNNMFIVMLVTLALGWLAIMGWRIFNAAKILWSVLEEGERDDKQ